MPARRRYSVRECLKNTINQRTLLRHFSQLLPALTIATLLALPASVTAKAPAVKAGTPLRFTTPGTLKFALIGQQLEYKRKLLFEGKDSARAYLNAYRKAKYWMPVDAAGSSIQFMNASNVMFGEVGGYAEGSGTSNGYFSFSTRYNNTVSERMRLGNNGISLLNGNDIFCSINKNGMSFTGETSNYWTPAYMDAFFNLGTGSLELGYTDVETGTRVLKVADHSLNLGDVFVLKEIPSLGISMDMTGVDYNFLHISEIDYRIGNSEDYPWIKGDASLSFKGIGSDFNVKRCDNLIFTNADDIPYFRAGRPSDYVNGSGALQVQLGDANNHLPASVSTDKIVTIDADGKLHKTTASALTGIPESFGAGLIRKFNSDLAIGNITPTDTSFNLFVEKGIRTRKITVDPNKWADYVFNNDYKLKTLPELEQYINTNKHLPDVPTAATVAKEGINVGDNQAVLLKKIEELTLYLIEQNKKIEEQQQINKGLQQQINELKGAKK